MTMAALLLMQVAALDAPVDFDLRKLAPKDACAPAAGDEIVVCGSRDQTALHRLEPLPERPAELLLPKAVFGIVGDIRGAVETDAEELPGGTVSNRIMLRMKVPF